MKIPVFFKTIRFKLTLWYSAFLVIVLASLVVGLNLAMIRSLQRPPTPMRPLPGDTQSWQQAFEDERVRSIQNLRNYSLIGAAVVLVVGVTGGFFLSGRMLKPVDRVSAVAGSISQSNLKERLRYRGPNDEIKRLADTFDTMLERLDNSFEAQKQFIQDASHELRTPIAIAQTNIEVIEMDGDATATDYHHVFEVIKLSLDRMTAVNDGLLMLSEGAPPKARWQKVDLPAFIAEVAAETAAKARALDIKLETQPVESGLTVDGDPVRLKQAVINLVHNGIKYNRPGGTVVLSAHREDDLIAIAVKDTGIGISCEDIPHVFDRFYRVDKSRSRVAGGSGLGLAIVKKIAEDHGGEVRVTSSPDVGSMFRLVLPTRNAASG
jgi:signal transduction histidine kinase